MAKEISGGTAHKLPDDLKKLLAADKAALGKWESLTPLARNEWICWVEFVKQAKTRQEHIDRVVPELKGGKRRPCCWLGCTHRTDKQLSKSQQWILEKRAKKA
ncbi:MAG: YdeI/OmpD-associated family protein [Candidatus Berkelbacteria bacterium]|nr:MAG: YdeI/OmpD-associated family protein [Candidatus Berkelbacteria bacterium]QQG51809.1 MAG: YdeI/OmpD-associated family protein [Candidatus Berkelbacteria bacterium]